jgi:hypothetical protein
VLNRRELVVGGGLTLVLDIVTEPCCAETPRIPNYRGCVVAHQDLPTNPYREAARKQDIIPKSGDPDFDYALAQTLSMLYHAFGVLPGFAYYDDQDERNANALAVPVNWLNRDDGTVLLGVNLLKKLRRNGESPEVAVATVCSHEFGHVLQFKNDLISQVDAGHKTVKRSELQADYFAGYFAGLRKRARPSYPAAVAALTQYNFGDTAFNQPDHHGTFEERGKAVVLGFEASYHDSKSLTEAIQESTTYVKGLRD